MTVKLYAFTCGTVTGEFAHLMEGGEGDITVPIPVFLIEHPRGRALFDTGLHRRGHQRYRHQVSRRRQRRIPENSAARLPERNFQDMLEN